MCGRFVSVSQRAFTHVQTALGLVNDVAAQWPEKERDVYPGALSPLVYENKLCEASFGITFSWARDKSRPLYNIRSESAAQKFGKLFAKGRAVAPAQRVFHWRSVAGQKRKEMLRLQSDEPLLLAALRDKDAFSVLTTEATHQSVNLHRMPVILSPENAKLWLDAQTPRETLEAFCAPALEIYEHKVTTLEQELASLAD